MKIEYDKPIEVTEAHWRTIVNHFSGSVAHRKENDKFWIKVWNMGSVKYIQQILENDF